MKQWTDEFEWESEAQEKGVLALVQYLKKFGRTALSAPSLLDLVAAWFIQKDHESNEWWSDTIGNQVNSLRSDLKIAHDEIRELKAVVRKLDENLKEVASGRSK